MTRVYGTPEGSRSLRLDEQKVGSFFARRAERIAELGPTRAVIYQDPHPDLAERRDEHERTTLTPLLSLDGRQRLLDIGCGTGRWTPSLRDRVTHYHGIDFAPGLVEYAKATYEDLPHVRFSVADAARFTLEGLGEDEPFDRALVSGVLIYLNDEALLEALRNLDRALSPDAVLLLREPVAQRERLTLVDHHSDDLDADYHAIYRTRAELTQALDAVLGSGRRTLVGHGFVYDDPSLNNRSDTRQEWFRVGAADS